MKQVIIKEDALRRVIRKTLLEYIGDEGEFGLDNEGNPVDDGYNEQPTNALVDDEDDHDMSTVGDEEFDPTEYDPDAYIDDDINDLDRIGDGYLYRGF